MSTSPEHDLLERLLTHAGVTQYTADAELFAEAAEAIGRLRQERDHLAARLFQTAAALGGAATLAAYPLRLRVSQVVSERPSASWLTRAYKLIEA